MLLARIVLQLRSRMRPDSVLSSAEDVVWRSQACLSQSWFVGFDSIGWRGSVLNIEGQAS